MKFKIQTTKGDVIIDESFSGIVHISDSEKQYWENGRLHRVGGPAIVTASGDEFYYQLGRLHREGGPAISSTDGYRFYFLNGERHRDDGAAVTLPGGFKEYWLHGVKYTREAFKTKTGKDND